MVTFTLPLLVSLSNVPEEITVYETLIPTILVIVALIFPELLNEIVFPLILPLELDVFIVSILKTSYKYFDILYYIISRLLFCE